MTSDKKQKVCYNNNIQPVAQNQCQALLLKRKKIIARTVLPYHWSGVGLCALSIISYLNIVMMSSKLVEAEITQRARQWHTTQLRPCQQ